ncbi:hypothetical protein NPX13_g9119 [Xylaria arbuscula]|uniref:gamma-glutamylcyclotransferase n=1 Tax=Xylaria arbuscula TaxID=114810 RepID=A0A9W8N761_9PEZI|nr:hypothetical protein NPX13_g9119 [Xylaria arbuscula]
MVVVSTLGQSVGNVWYLAYGSNLSSSKFVKDRGIKPLAAVLVAVPGFTLAMQSAGVPYQEPSYASIRPLSECVTCKEKTVLGTAYLVTPSQYTEIIRSEGGGIAYKEISVRVTPLKISTELESNNLHEARNKDLSEARTLVSLMIRLPAPCPSQRYMNLIVDGAIESRYPLDYQLYLKNIRTYKPATHPRAKLGAELFLCLWIPIMTLAERITKLSIAWFGDEYGNAPYAIILLIRAVVKAMWWHHDNLHAPIWGRGDGLDPSAVNDFEV